MERKREVHIKRDLFPSLSLSKLYWLHSSSLILSQYFFSTVARCPPLTGGVMQESVLLPVALLYCDFVVLLVHMDPACSHDPRCFFERCPLGIYKMLEHFPMFPHFPLRRGCIFFFVTVCGYLFLMHRQSIMGFSLFLTYF